MRLFSRLQDSISISLNSLKSNKLRSFLTMLGVIIGVFSVVSLVALGRGFENYITSQFDALGSNVLFVSPGNFTGAQDPSLSFTKNKLNTKMVDLIKTYGSQNLTYVTPSVNLNGTFSYKSKKYFGEIFGTNFEGNKVFNYEIDKGRFFNRADERASRNVIVIGPQVATELFGSLDPIGKTLKLNNKNFFVIGTFKSKGSDFDSQVIAPYTSIMNVFNIKRLTYIVGKVNDASNMDTAKRQIELALLRELDDEDFSVLSSADILSTIQQVLSILTIGLSAIAAISLLVGGIGIMNIMLVTVTERTREVGLRIALGATKSDIAFQFLFESVILSVIGGFIGLGLAFALSLGLQSFIQAEVPPITIAMSFMFSLVVGIIFGTYPAYTASKKDPIEALRYE